MSQDDELKRASLYLQLGPDEMENVKAEHKKWEARRRTAIAYDHGQCGRCDKPKQSADAIFCPACSCEIGAAIEHGDTGSPVEAITFSPLCCSTCGDLIEESNRSCVHAKCHPCLMQSIHDRYLADHQAKVDKKLAEEMPYTLLMGLMVLLAAACAGLAAWGFAAGVSKLAYWLGFYA